MTKTQVLNSIANGQDFEVKFIKRSNRQLREMKCCKGIPRNLRGGPRAYNPADHRLVCVWDVEKQAYRSIPLEGILTIAVNGQTHEFPLSEAS
jgi:hypothetical protein